MYKQTYAVCKIIKVQATTCKYIYSVSLVKIIMQNKKKNILFEKTFTFQNRIVNLKELLKWFKLFKYYRI